MRARVTRGQSGTFNDQTLQEGAGKPREEAEKVDYQVWRGSASARRQERPSIHLRPRLCFVHWRTVVSAYCTIASKSAATPPRFLFGFGLQYNHRSVLYHQCVISRDSDLAHRYTAEGSIIITGYLERPNNCHNVVLVLLFLASSWFTPISIVSVNSRVLVKR